MILKETMAILGAVLIASGAFGSGFALYEPSVVYHAMGGAVVGKAMDASANFANPATLTDLTNIWVTVGFVTEHPRGNVRGRCDGRSWGDETMDPGLFWLPHAQVAIPLPADFVFGLGLQAEYGLGTSYRDGWIMNWSTTETTVQGLVINPNLAYKITDSWSVGAGIRWLFFDFEQYSKPYCAQNVDFGPPLGVHTANFGQFNNRLKGDNEFKSIGWQVGTKYDVTETFSVGAVYKSAIDVTVKGRTSNSPYVANVDTWSTLAAGSYGMTPQQMLAYQAATHSGDAEADLTLPQSITAGCNWDCAKDWHLGAAVSWTQWSQFDMLTFRLPPSGPDGDKHTKLNWRDTWRGSLGACWDFAEDWRWMISYTYDMDSTDQTQESAMLPPADRHIAASGFAWDCWAGFELALSYSCIFMDGRGMDTTDALGRSYHLETCRGFCHAVGFSVTYRF